MPSPSTVERPHGTFRTFGIANTYTSAVEAAGGIPIVIPPQAGNAVQLAGLIDGLILSGGGDIDPAHYDDADVHPKTYGIDEGRDVLELALAREAIDRELPTLCICRGIQVLNVALNGTLYQDVADQFGGDLEHRQQTQSTPKEEPWHSVTITPESLLGDVYGGNEIQVNSFHHQGIRDIGDGLTVVAVTADGLVEGVELPSHPWLLGVQWHPEMMWAAHSEHLRPFTGLVRAATRSAAVPA